MRFHIRPLVLVSVAVVLGSSSAQTVPIISQLGQDLNGDLAPDLFGFSVSLSGNGRTVAVGAVGHDGANQDSGQARIFDLVGNTWIQLGQDIEGFDKHDSNGNSISLSDDGRTVAIAAFGNDLDNNQSPGFTRIFGFNEAQQIWVQIGQTIFGESPQDQSGRWISLSSNGRTVAIGAPINSGATGFRSGHVRVFEFDGVLQSWVQKGDDIDGENAEDFSGGSEEVSLSGDGTTLAIGSGSNDGGTGDATNIGHTRVFKFDSTLNTWIQVGQDIDGENAGDRSGTSVSLSSNGKAVAIGALFNDGLTSDGTVGVDTGSVRIFVFNDIINAWVQQGQDIDGEGENDQSGSSVSLSGDGRTVAIGSVGNDANGVTNTGHVRIFELVGTSWIQKGTNINGRSANDFFGGSVALSRDGQTVAVGSFSINDGRGQTRVFDVSLQSSIVSTPKRDESDSNDIVFIGLGIGGGIVFLSLGSLFLLYVRRRSKSALKITDQSELDFKNSWFSHMYPGKLSNVQINQVTGKKQKRIGWFTSTFGDKYVDVEDGTMVEKVDGQSI